MYRSLLTAVKPSPSHSYVIEQSVVAARDLGARLHICVVLDVERIAPREAMPPGAGSYKQARDAEMASTARAAAHTALKSSLAAAAAVGIGCEAEVIEGDVVQVLGRRSQEHDLLIVGHAPGDRGDEGLLHSVLKASARPTLVVPEEAGFGRSVVVGYDGSRQAARALGALAASGLSAGRAIHVVSCHDDPAVAAADCELACRFLGRHGLAATAFAETSGGDPATRLIDYCRRVDAGLLVAGAFGHSTLRELLFGSTTRRLLGELPLPVLLDR